MMVVSPAILQPFTRKITGTDDLALGHFGSTGYLLSALVGKAIGKGSPSIEELKVPKTLNFLRDSSVAISLTMMILFLILVLVAGKEFVETSISGGQNFIIFCHYPVADLRGRRVDHPCGCSHDYCRNCSGL